MKKQPKKTKGTFEDLRPELDRLKSLMEKDEAKPGKQSVEDMQERDFYNIKRHGQSNQK